MIAIAFEAYKYPKDFVDVPGVEETARDGTKVTYVNKYVSNARRFISSCTSRTELEQCMEGILKVQLHSGQDVKDTKKFAFSGRTNPYVVFTYGTSTSKSNVVENSLSPEWNSVHYLYVKKRSIIVNHKDHLVVDLYNKVTQDRLGICEALCSPFDRQVLTGRALIPLEDLRGSGFHQKEVEIIEKKPRKDGKRAILKLSAKLLTVEEYCKEVGRSDESHWLDSYYVENKTRSWSQLYQKASIHPSLAKPYAYFDSDKSGTNAWLHVYEGIKTVVLAFRGTEVGEFADIISDIDIRPEALSRLYSTPYVISPNHVCSESAIFIHGGFFRAYKSVHETVLDTIYSITGWDEEWAILVTGHSLGGALAVLSAYELTNRVNERGSGPQVGMMNVGAPRTGNRRFVRSYNSSVNPSFRVVNDRDTVPTIPHLYFHVDNEILVNPDGKLLIDDELLQSGMTREEFKKYISEEKERRRNLSKAISVHTVKGALAAEYHRQPYYFEVVQSAVMGLFSSKLTDVSEAGPSSSQEQTTTTQEQTTTPAPKTA
eukprot:g3326.t1